MRWGTSAEQQRVNAEELRQRRQMTDEEGLSEIPPDTVEDLFADDGTGENRIFFILGLHPIGVANPPRLFGKP